MTFLPLVRLWLWISVFASVAGWLLSGLGQLNQGGYIVFGCVAIAAFWLADKRSPLGGRPLSSAFEGRAGEGSEAGLRRLARTFNWKKIRRRFSHPFPLAFGLLALLAVLGAVLYPPTNHTALAYRTPRVLQWLAQGQWFWIHTPNYRMNDRACGFEWLSAPLLLFTKSDRALFVVNFIPFLLLPGLVFSVFTRLGVRPRAAWYWMWILPAGYTFLLQAGSLANDTFPTVYALAAVDFGCRGLVSRRASDAGLSLLGAALLTGAKASNIPLLLPWLILFVPQVAVLARKLLLFAGFLLLAVTVSFLPTAVMNVAYCGDWSGMNLERAGMNMKDPLVGIWGNLLLFLSNNFAPPFFPQAAWWNQSALSILPRAIVNPMAANFENGFHQLAELPTEDWAGLGFGVSLLVLVSALYRPCRADHKASLEGTAGTVSKPLRNAALVSPWIALLGFCAKSGMVTGARLISPYYPLLLPLLLTGARQSALVRRRWWRSLAFGLLLLAFPVIILTPGRPLWPARQVLTKLQDMHIAPRLAARAMKVYAVYSGRSDPLASLRASLPPGLRVVGFMADGDDLDISLWRPFGTRRVEHIRLADTAAQIRQREIGYAVVGGANLAASGVALTDWLRRTEAEVIATNTATLKVTEGPQPWYIVRFNP